MSPDTISTGPDPPVEAVEPWKLYASSFSASSAASTVGKYCGRQPAITALIAASCTEQWRPVVPWLATISSGGRPAAARKRSTRSRAGGTTGSPSVQPCS